MENSDQFQNTFLKTEFANMDAINARFYGKFPFPWRTVRVDYYSERDLERKFLCQNLGDWKHKEIPERPRIWVAGCGTNQAVITALNFPNAQVIGSDLSSPSLERAYRSAREMSIQNLDLRQESINEANYQEEFDYIICTGVIHHNSNPHYAAKKLSQALRSTGVLELMVYNRFHRILTSSFQMALRLLSGSMEPGNPDELKITTSLIRDFPMNCLMKEFLNGYRQAPQEQMADALMQPIEFSYTIETLRKLAEEAGLEIDQPCINQFDRSIDAWQWNMSFQDPIVKDRYGALDDFMRWQITNLLACELSPKLWFYLRKKDIQRRSEKQICYDFMNGVFRQNSTLREVFFLNSKDSYERAPPLADYPSRQRLGSLGAIVNLCDGRKTMKEVLGNLRISVDFFALNEIRQRLTTLAFPYLIAV